MKIGATTLPLAGWITDIRKPEESRVHRLNAIQGLVEKYHLSAVELTLDLAMVFPQVFDAGFYNRVAELQTALEFTCTAHLPFLWLDLASPNESIRQASVNSINKTAELTRDIQVETFVLHLWGNTTSQIMVALDHPAQRKAALGAAMAQAERSLAQICQAIEPHRLCVENLETPSFDFALPLVEKYGTSICLDVGHLAWRGDNEMDFLARHYERIREVHLHDTRLEQVGDYQKNIDHLPLGQGDMDFEAFLKELAALDFSGAVILENNTLADLELSLEMIKRANICSYSA